LKEFKFNLEEYTGDSIDGLKTSLDIGALKREIETQLDQGIEIMI